MNLDEFRNKVMKGRLFSNWNKVEGDHIKYDSICILKDDIRVSVRMREDYVVKDFKEKWTEKFMNSNASSSYVEFCFNGEVIERKLVVYVDGCRGTILYPSKELDDTMKELKYFYRKDDLVIAKIVEDLFSLKGTGALVSDIITKEKWEVRG